MKVLICDSDAMARYVLRRLLLRIYGCSVVECANGVEALDHLTSDVFDLLILDVSMPVLDGFETLQIIRESPDLRRLPVVMLTADRSEPAVRRAIDLGVVDYHVKPAKGERLRDMFIRLTHASCGAGPLAAVAETSTVTIESTTPVMIVDGDDDFRTFFADAVSPYCPVLEAPSGTVALTMAASQLPSILFIGRDLGALQPAFLARNISKLGHVRIVKLATPDEAAVASASPLYHDVIARTLVAPVLLHELRRFIKQNGGPLHRVMELVPGLRSSLIKTTANTFGMMLSQEIDVAESEVDVPVGAHAVVDVVIAEQMAIRFEVQCSAALARQLAAPAFGDDVDLPTAIGMLGEVGNVITGRLQANLMEQGVKCSCSLPVYTEGPSGIDEPAEGAERLALQFALAGSDERFRLVLDVSRVSEPSEPGVDARPPEVVGQ